MKKYIVCFATSATSFSHLQLETETIIEENEKHGDILMEDFIDSYSNLTLKTLFMLKHFRDR